MLANPCCCNTSTCNQVCCDGGKWPDQINCDLSLLSLTNNGCDVCDTLDGTYVLDYDTVSSNPNNNCIWKYTSPTLCGYTLDCTPDKDVTVKLLIIATLTIECNWSVLVYLDTLGGDDSCPNADKSATYTITSSGESDCDGMTLTKSSESSSENYTCIGSFPATIGLSR